MAEGAGMSDDMDSWVEAVRETWPEVAEFMERSIAEVAALTAERDALRAALSGMVEVFENLVSDPNDWTAVSRARAALGEQS